MVTQIGVVRRASRSNGKSSSGSGYHPAPFPPAHPAGNPAGASPPPRKRRDGLQRSKCRGRRCHRAASLPPSGPGAGGWNEWQVCTLRCWFRAAVNSGARTLCATGASPGKTLTNESTYQALNSACEPFPCAAPAEMQQLRAMIATNERNIQPSGLRNRVARSFLKPDSRQGQCLRRTRIYYLGSIWE